MVSTSYTKGRAREYRVLQMLRKGGWLCSRSAASHSAVDVFACRDGEVLLVQVKSGRARVSAKERSELMMWAEASGARVEVWFFPKHRGVRIEVISGG
jgi:Holliday junction resolvase